MIFKMWNYYATYTNYLEQRGVVKTLFCYKDQRFGCLSRAAAVLLFNVEYFQQFLDENPQISNRLACLVRELLTLPYLRTVFAVWAAVGVHVVEPFYVMTISKDSTHSRLKEYYQTLHTDLGKKQDERLLQLESSVLESVSQELFEGVAASYGEHVLAAVRAAAMENTEESLNLLNLFMIEMREVLARQRRDYNLSDQFPAEYPVFQQASKIDDCPVNNLDMERACGLVDHRLKKLRTLQAVSRSLILARADELRGGKKSEFRGFKEECERKRQLELEWRQETKEKFAKGAEEKQIVAQAKERKRLNMLDCLKGSGGPFTSAEEVEQFLQQPGPEKDKQQRMKKELQFARESSTTLPACDPMFRIQVTMPNKRRRDKTAREFGDALVAFLGKKADSAALPYDLFSTSLQKFTVERDAIS